MTATPKPKAKADKPKVTDAITALVDATKNLKPDELERMSQLGFVVPSGDVESALRGEFPLGYRCPHCNKVALYFVGNSWHGQVMTLHGLNLEKEVPPLHLPIDQIAWTQKGRKASEINRHSPTCQHCGQACELGANRTLRAKLIVDVKAFEQARDRAFDRETIRKTRQEVGGADAVGGISSNYNDPRDVPSQFMSPEKQAEVSYLAERYDPLAVTRSTKPGGGG